MKPAHRAGLAGLSARRWARRSPIRRRRASGPAFNSSSGPARACALT